MLPKLAESFKRILYLSGMLVLGAYAHSSFAQSFSATIIQDSSYVASGGLDEHQVTHRALGIFSFEYRLDDSIKFYADAQVQRGDNGSDVVGDLQAYSNIDEDDLNKIYEVWVEKSFNEGELRFKLGQVDANSEFAYPVHGEEFINSSMGFSPTISYLPTYPTPRLSINAFWKASQNTQFAIGHYADENNRLDDSFTIAQWTQQLGSVNATLGAWHQSGGIAPLIESPENEAFLETNADGLFAVLSGDLDAQFFKSTSTNWFAQYGSSDDKTSEVDTHIGAGLVWYGVNQREDDMLGIALTHIKISPLLFNQYKKNETSVEVFYRYQLNDYFAIKPDIQIIANPAARIEAEDAVVFTMRFELSI